MPSESSSSGSRSAPASETCARTCSDTPGRRTFTARARDPKFDMQVEGGWTTGRMVERYCKARPFEERRKAPSPFTASRAALSEKRPSEKGPSQQRGGLYGKRIA